MQGTDTKSWAIVTAASPFNLSCLWNSQTGHCQTHPSLYANASRGSNQIPLVNAFCFDARRDDLFRNQSSLSFIRQKKKQLSYSYRYSSCIIDTVVISWPRYSCLYSRIKGQNCVRHPSTLRMAHDNQSIYSSQWVRTCHPLSEAAAPFVHGPPPLH
jgi:hypothetical protein